MATLSELETIWSLDDMYRANAILDMQLDLEQEVSRKLKNDNRQRASN